MASSSGTSDWYPGQVWPAEGDVSSLEGRAETKLIVKNTGDRPIQVGSHYHFFETNKALDFDRDAAFGMRLKISAGTAVRFEPGQSHEVELIAMGGERIGLGLNGLTDGSLDDTKIKERALERARERGFKGA